eukprot:3277433-Amphidinium_carterae.1
MCARPAAKVPLFGNVTLELALCVGPLRRNMSKDGWLHWWPEKPATCSRFGPVGFEEAAEHCKADRGCSGLLCSM